MVLPEDIVEKIMKEVHKMRMECVFDEMYEKIHRMRMNEVLDELHEMNVVDEFNGYYFGREE